MIFDKKEIGLKIKAARKMRGYTQSKLAELINVSDRTINLMETGKSGMTLKTLIKFCNALNVSPNYILSYEIQENSLEEAIKNLNDNELTTIKNFFNNL